MVCIKRSRRLSILSVFIALVVGLGCALIIKSSALAVEKPDKSDQADKLTNISQNCSSIKQSLGQLQHADSRTRAYLGAAYETMANTFITPLNLRLVRNNRPDAELLEIQASFTAEQAKFRSAYTDYMRELENLIAVNCVNQPEEFYQHLEVTRERRATLRNTTTQLNNLIKKQLNATQRLQETLK